MIKLGLAHKFFLICELIAVTCDMFLLMACLPREICAEQRSAAACLPIGGEGKESAICLCFVLLLAFTKKGKGKLIHVKLRLERKERTAGVLLARLLRGARNDRGVLFLGFGTNS